MGLGSQYTISRTHIWHHYAYVIWNYRDTLQHNSDHAIHHHHQEFQKQPQ